jgi:hypothetical protein
MIFTLLLLVPVAALLWLALVSHSGMPKRIGAIAAAAVTVAGAMSVPPMVPDELGSYRIATARDVLALVAAAAGSIYLLVWTRIHRGRGRNRTLASIAAIIGLVPILAAIAAAFVSTR